MAGTHIWNDEDNVGRVLDPPDPVSCDGNFDKDKCGCCVGYDDCLKKNGGELNEFRE